MAVLIFGLVVISNPLYAAEVPAEVPTEDALQSAPWQVRLERVDAQNTDTSANSSVTSDSEMPSISDIQTEILEMFTEPAGCELGYVDSINDLFVGDKQYSATIGIWSNCQIETTYHGLLVAEPLGIDGMKVVLRAELTQPDDLESLLNALSQQLDQPVGRLANAAEANQPTTTVPTDSSLVTNPPTPTNSSVPTTTSGLSFRLLASPTTVPDSEEAARPEAAAKPEATTTPENTVSQETTAAPEATETPAAIPTATSEAYTAIALVQAEALNLRAGPGINYAKRGTVSKGDRLVVTGRISNCVWLEILTSARRTLWVSGSSQFVSLEGDCGSIPQANIPPTPPPAPRQLDSYNPDTALTDPTKACYLIENFLNVALTFTMTRPSDEWSRTFVVPAKVEQLECFAPALYTYTIDAPPPWDSINARLNAAAGDALRWSIGGK